MPPRRGRSARNLTEEENTPTTEDAVQQELAERPLPAAQNSPTPAADSEAGEDRGSRSPVASGSETRSSKKRSRSGSPISHDASRPRSPIPATPPPPKPKPRRPTKLRYRPSLVLHGHKRGVSSVKFSPDGRWIASCSADCTIKIWDAFTGRLQRTLEGHLAGINTISWSPDSTLLASGSDDKSIRLWDALSGKPQPVPFLGHHNYIYSLAFSPKGNMIVSGSYDEAVFIWDVRGARVMKSLPAHSDPVSGVDFVRDGTLVVSCAGDGLIRVWDTASGQCLRTLVHEDNAPVTSCKFTPNGKFVLAWTVDSSIRLWDYIDGRAVKTYQGHVNQKYSLSGAFGTYGKDAHRRSDDANNEEGAVWAFVASGSEDGKVVLWDVRSKDILQELQGHCAPVLGVDTHPTERRIVSCGLDKSIRVWVCDSDGEDYDVPTEAGIQQDFEMFGAQLLQAAGED